MYAFRANSGYARIDPRDVYELRIPDDAAIRIRILKGGGSLIPF